MPIDTILFLHIPKAAGTTLLAVLTREYGQDAVLKLSDTNLLQTIQEYDALPREDKSCFKVIEGHFPFGIHQHVPLENTYITLVRNPVERVISHYHHVRNLPTHYAYQQGFTAQTSLFEYINSNIARDETHDGQVWMLSGGQDSQEYPSAALQKALQNLESHFLLAAPSEMFDEAVIMLKNQLGWKKMPFYFRRRIGNYRSKRANSAGEGIEAILRANQNDLELYRQVREHFIDMMRRAGPAFQRQVRLFKVFNQQYQNYRLFRQRGSRLFRRFVWGENYT